jgi:hypothetical protein
LQLSNKLEPPFRRKLQPGHRKQEADLAKRGGTTHPASGRIWRFKRDGRLFDFLVEARTTEKETYTISGPEMDDIRKEASMTPPGCLPAMQIDIQHRRFMLIDHEVFIESQNLLVSLMAEAGRE